MTDSAIEKELVAIKTIANALEPFDPSARRRVLQYATQHLGIADVPTGQPSAMPATSGTVGDEIRVLQTVADTEDKIVDIRTFTQQKNPRSDVQMAAVVAYYLAKLAPEELRRDSITAEDVPEYFGRGKYPLPKNSGMTLVNAKNAGYLDAAGQGKYKLNPVGHNLVVHNLPRSEASKPVGLSRAKKATRGNAKGRKTGKRTPKKTG